MKLILCLIALAYHPDRNPGREDEVTATFQKIQSAHEILTDPLERSKYDSTRTRSNFTSTFASRASTRGNPYSNYGAEWPKPPPRPGGPGPTKNPPPSSGASRYSKFQAPKTSASAAAQEGPAARENTFKAWENMRNQSKTNARAGAGPGQTWAAPKAPPKEHTPQSGREESNSFKYAPPPKARPGYDEFSTAYRSSDETSPRRSQSSARKNGFMPSTPGPDEPAAAKGAYQTQRGTRPVPNPPVPPRGDPSSASNMGPPPSPTNRDPLRQFKEKSNVFFEPRVSTPYATHGGEKLNPFESANVGRSKSARVRSDKFDNARQVPRMGSDPNLQSERDKSGYGDHTPRNAQSYNSSPVDSDSPDGLGINRNAAEKARKLAKARKSAAAAVSQEQGGPNVAPGSEKQRKQSNISIKDFRNWYQEHPHEDHPLNDLPSDGPSGGSGQANNPIGKPSMYEKFDFPMSAPKLAVPRAKAATVSEAIPSKTGIFAGGTNGSTLNQDSFNVKFPEFTSRFANLKMNSPLKPPSGASARPINSFGTQKRKSTGPALPHGCTPPTKLNSFEVTQRSIVDQLLAKKEQAERSSREPEPNGHPVTTADPHYQHFSSGDSTTAEMGSPVKKPSCVDPAQHNPSADHLRFWLSNNKTYANLKGASSFSTNFSMFSMPINDDTFTPTRPMSGFPNHSADDINTKFAAEDWHGKFEAGNCFVPDQKPGNPPRRTRTQSTSRSATRGRSPVKFTGSIPTREGTSADPKVFPPPTQNGVDQSPSGTKFSAEQWQETFKTQTFAPAFSPSPVGATPNVSRPSTKKSRGPRPTMGSAAVFVSSSSDDSSSDEQDQYPETMRAGRVASPDAMDVDTPPAAHSTATPKANEKLQVNTEPQKRAATSPLGTEALNVNFEDLEIKDLISSLNLPTPPKAPVLKQSADDATNSTTRTEYITKFQAYMKSWDLFNTRMMLHIVARKNQNDTLGATRWESAQGLKEYTRGLKTDAAVLQHWVVATNAHEKDMKDYTAISATIGGTDTERPRKKTH